jgi:predicted TIM-barrel fold metal-dependent hydrolase
VEHWDWEGASVGELRVLDLHGHIPDDLFDRRLPDGGYDASADLAAREAQMDRVGVTASVLLAPSLYERPNGIADTRRVNDCVAWYRTLRPARFPVALGTVEPFHGRDAGLAEIARLVDDLHLNGVVWDHYHQGTGIDEPRMVAFVTELARRGLPAVLHTHPFDERESPVRVAALARRVPEATVVALGGLSALHDEWQLRDIATETPNLLFDTTVTLPLAPLERYVEILGSQRLLFGTGMHLNPRWTASRSAVLDELLESSALGESDRDNILWANAARIFGGPIR